MNATMTRLSKAMPNLDCTVNEDAAVSDEAEVLTAHPGSASDLAALVKWARTERIPLLARSSARPHQTSRPDIASVIVDMSAMNSVVRVDRRNRVALFEAGVNFATLGSALAGAGLRLQTPLCPREGKSALAAYIEREPVIMPKYQWDISDPLLCLEVVYGTGDTFRTGSAAGPGSLEQQWEAGEAQKGPMGPGHADWMRVIQGAQGAIAIATWASAKAEIAPSIETLLVMGADTPAPLIETTYRTLRRGVVDTCFLIDRHGAADLLAPDARSRDEAERRASNWNLIVSVSGLDYHAKARHSHHLKTVTREARAAGARMIDPPHGSADSVMAVLSRPSAGTFWKERRLGASRRVFFQTTLDRAPTFCESFAGHAAAAGIGPERISTYIQPQLGGRLAHVEFIVACVPDSAEEAATASFADHVAAPLIAEGAYFSRPYGAWAAPAFDAAKSSIAIFEKAKDIFDPDRILAPGRLALKGNSNGYGL